MKKEGNVFIVSAPSGCGKTTIVNRILHDLREIKRSVSATTRRPRAGEIANEDYYFISEQAFKNKVQKGEFLEWAKNFGYYYGTIKKNVMDCIKSGKDIILTIDVKGAAQAKKKMPESVLVFISPPSFDDLAKRLRKRATDKQKEVKERLKVAKKEMTQAKKYDYIIVNDSLKCAVDKLRSVIIAKRCEI